MLDTIHKLRCSGATLVGCLLGFLWLGTLMQREQMTAYGRLSTSVADESPHVSKQQQQQHRKTTQGTKRQRPNVLFLICDDLNDYIERYGGHPQARTPHIRRLMHTSVSFTQAHANIPVCKESRTSFLTGLYPHTSKYLRGGGLPLPEKFKGLRNQRTIVEHFNENGYVTMGTGKIYHGHKATYWQEEGFKTDYGPFVYDTSLANHRGARDKTLENLPHPLVKAPFRDHGPVLGSFGPLKRLPGDLAWRTGNRYRGYRAIEFLGDGERNMTTDEQSAAWAVQKLQEMDAADEANDKPFFLGVGLVRPHTPMVVSQKYFDLYPLNDLEFPPSLLEYDANDTLRNTLYDEGFGQIMYQDLVESYNFRKAALRRYLRAYMASVSAADELIGQVVNALDKTRFKDNTIVVLTSDHGYVVGQKDYLGKNLLWQATTRVPLIVRVPGMTTDEVGAGRALTSRGPPRTSDRLVSLIDLFPTLIDLCDLPKNTSKNELGRPLDGHSLKPFLSSSDDHSAISWDGPDFALSALSFDFVPEDRIGMSLTTRYENWRYIRYANGEEELYDTAKDPYEWTNLLAGADNSTFAPLLEEFRSEMFRFVEEGGSDAALQLEQPNIFDHGSKDDGDDHSLDPLTFFGTFGRPHRPWPRPFPVPERDIETGKGV